MMLSDPLLADICRRAGFAGDDLVLAIACAKAASNGIPAYDHAIWPGPVARYKGLYGVDVVAWPDIADVALDNPYEAARVAHELTAATGSWHWCPAYRSGAHHHHLDAAKIASTQLPGREPLQVPNMAPHARRAWEGDRDRLAELVAGYVAQHGGRH